MQFVVIVGLHLTVSFRTFVYFDLQFSIFQNNYLVYFYDRINLIMSMILFMLTHSDNKCMTNKGILKNYMRKF